MSRLKKIIIDHVYISEMYEELDKFTLLLEDSKYEGITIMTDYFSQHMNINEKNFSREFNAILSDLISYFNNKEAIIEQLPAQFVFNDEFKKRFISILPISEQNILDTINEWNKETSIVQGGKEIKGRSIEEQFVLSFPYAYLAFTVKNKELSTNILLMLNMLMYSMAYSISFPKYNYNKDKGQYVIQNILKNKGFAKYNSVYDLMIKLSNDTYNTYASKLSDRTIYEAIWSNIRVKMNYYMKGFHEAYQTIGSLYLTTNKDLASTSDRDGNDATVETNVENDSVVVLKISKDVTDYVNNPSYIEYSIMRNVLSKIMGIDMNAKRGTSIDRKTLVERNLYSMIEEIQKTNDFETIISNILQNFLWTDGNTVKHIETPAFVDKIIYDLSYIGKNKIYINNITKILDKYIDMVLEEKGKNTSNVDNKTLQKYRKTIIYYFAFLTQLVAKRS